MFSILQIIKNIYVKLGGSSEDVSAYRTIGPILNKMIDYIEPSSGSGYDVEYSSEERVVGTWINGKPLYEKTWQFENKIVAVADASSELKHNIENFEIGVVTEAYYQSDAVAQWSTANFIQLDSTTFYEAAWNMSATAFRIRVKGITSISANANRKYIIKARYTKTTDTASS